MAHGSSLNSLESQPKTCKLLKTDHLYLRLSHSKSQNVISSRVSTVGAAQIVREKLKG